jgi:hypothetical protein
MPHTPIHITDISASTFQPFESVYRQYLAGLAAPYARVGAAQQAPQAQMAYWTAPSAAGYQAPSGAGVNPFRQFLGEGFGTNVGGGAYSPLTASQWMSRASNVQNMLGTTLDPSMIGAEMVDPNDPNAMIVNPNYDPTVTATATMQGRFGMGGEDPASAAANQARLVNQAVLAQTPMALRGETSGILQSLFDQWQGAGVPGSYLQNRQNIWGAFGL